MREFVLLERFCSTLTPDGAVVVGPGDDAAVLAMAGVQTPAEGLLVSVDQLIEGLHFRLPATPLGFVGRKAVARALSDIAAMGGVPVACVCAAALPVEFGEDETEVLFAAVRDAAIEFGAPLVGGDLAVHARSGLPLILTVTVLGQAVPPGAVRRDGARPGDGIYVTGALGATFEPDGSGHHLSFSPRLSEGRCLREALGPRLHAMIDVSDGLGRDAGHVARASAVVLEIETAALPRRANATWRQAASDGEDYELLFCAEGAVPSAIAGCPITKIGTVLNEDAIGGGAPVDRPGPRVRLLEGKVVHAGDTMGWEHRSGDS